MKAKLEYKNDKMVLSLKNALEEQRKQMMSLAGYGTTVKLLKDKGIKTYIPFDKNDRDNASGRTLCSMFNVAEVIDAIFNLSYEIDGYPRAVEARGGENTIEIVFSKSEEGDFISFGTELYIYDYEMCEVFTNDEEVKKVIEDIMKNSKKHIALSVTADIAQ